MPDITLIHLKYLFLFPVIFRNTSSLTIEVIKSEKNKNQINRGDLHTAGRPKSDDESSDCEIIAISPNFDMSLGVTGVTKPAAHAVNSAAKSDLVLGGGTRQLIPLVGQPEVSPSASFYEPPTLLSNLLEDNDDDSNINSSNNSNDCDNDNNSTKFSVGESSSLDLSLSLMDKFLAQDRISDLDLTPLKRAMDPTSEMPEAKKPKLNPALEITSLPPQVLARIFSFLPGFEVMNRIVRVCKLFHEACQDPNLWLSVKIGRG